MCTQKCRDWLWKKDNDLRDISLRLYDKMNFKLNKMKESVSVNKRSRLTECLICKKCFHNKKDKSNPTAVQEQQDITPVKSPLSSGHEKKNIAKEENEHNYSISNIPTQSGDDKTSKRKVQKTEDNERHSTDIQEAIDNRSPSWGKYHKKENNKKHSRIKVNEAESKKKRKSKKTSRRKVQKTEGNESHSTHIQETGDNKRPSQKQVRKKEDSKKHSRRKVHGTESEKTRNKKTSKRKFQKKEDNEIQKEDIQGTVHNKSPSRRKVHKTVDNKELKNKKVHKTGFKKIRCW